MKTKHYAKFLSRAAHLEADIELVDVIKISSNSGKLHTHGNALLFDDISAQQHPRLAARANSGTARRNALNHLKATLGASYIKDTYEDLYMYLQAILYGAARKGLDPARLIGEHKVTVEANDLLKAGSWPNVVQIVTNSIFRRLENEKSTKDLIQKIDAKLNLGIPAAVLHAALPYLEMRHLLIHADGIADQKFCNDFPAVGATVGAKIDIGYGTVTQARTAILDLVKEIDDRVIANDLLPATDLQP